MSKYKGIDKKTLKLIKKLKKMKKDKKKAKRKIKRAQKKKEESQESFFGKNRIGGASGGFSSGATHTNTVVVPNQQPNQQPIQTPQNQLIPYDNKKEKEENENRFKNLQTSTDNLIAFGNKFYNDQKIINTHIGQQQQQLMQQQYELSQPKKRGPRKAPKKEPVINLPDVQPLKFIDPKQQYQKEQNINALESIIQQYIIPPTPKQSANPNDNIGGATQKNSSDNFIEETPEIFGAPEEPQVDAPVDVPVDVPEPVDIPVDEPVDEEQQVDEYGDEEKAPEPDPEDAFMFGKRKTIQQLINDMSAQQRAKYRQIAAKNDLSVEEYLLIRAINKNYSGDYTGVKAFLENKGTKKLGKK